MTETNATRAISVMVTPEVHEKLRTIAEEDKRTLSNLVRLILDEWLEDE